MELTKHILKEAVEAFKKAQLNEEVQEKNFKESIPKTSIEDFEGLALKEFIANNPFLSEADNPFLPEADNPSLSE